jgi:hypothetical protein
MSALRARGTLEQTTSHLEGGSAMSTFSKEQAATDSTTAPITVPTQRSGRGRVVRLVFGSLALLAGLALLGGAIAAIFGLENNRDASGYFVTHTHHYMTSSYALSTESMNVGGVTGDLEAALIRLRIKATSSNAAKPLFVGIATTQNVDRYLARVQHDELRDISFDPFKIDYRRIGTGAPTTLPGTQSFWQTRASGTGTLTVSWPVKKGKWTAVVMNADGSRNVHVDAQVAARLAGAWWFVAACIALGALALAGGVLLVRSGTRKEA